MLFKSYVLVGGESKEVPVYTTKLYGLYFLPNMRWVIKSRRSWAGHVVHKGDRKGVCRVLVGKLDEKRPHT
jgi:hypothetical protein